VSETLRCIAPGDGSLVAERELADAAAVDRALERARRCQAEWRRVPVGERARLASRAVDALLGRRHEIAPEISRQMGRPVAHAPGEIAGFEERARHMIAIAPEALADHRPEPRPGSTRFVRREPLGVVLTIAPWNYPYLTAVNSVVPAILAGNAVLLKHSAQTPLCAERMAAAFLEAGAPEGLLQALHLSHAGAARLIGRRDGPDFVAFTGSVAAGHRVQEAAVSRFIGVGLELGGKDPGYVRADADPEAAAEGLVDGAFFNAGQSCCAIERIYVAAPVFDAFVEVAAELVRALRLGDPLDPETTLGPLVSTAAADFVRGQIDEAVAAGARPLVDPAAFPDAAAGTPYCAPQLLVDVDPGMRVMSEESFGPVVGVQKVEGDEEALALMNDSAYGLTASLWTRDREAALRLGQRLETGTVFQNRCDYLDPALAWTGVKDSGRGCSLSVLGYETLTRPKSFHLMDGG